MQMPPCNTTKVSARSARRHPAQWALLAATIMLPLGSEAFAATAPAAMPTQGIKAFRLCTGADNLTHVVRGTLDQKAMVDTRALHFSETPAYSTYNWHPAPEEQYVITLSGTLEFSTTGGENFVLHPGEVLLAQDTTGPGHRWKLIDDQPWRRAYILTQPNAAKAFVPEQGSYNKGGCGA